MAEKLSEDIIVGMIEAVGAEYVYGSYKDSKTPFLFKCSQCGSEGKIIIGNFRKGKNKNLLCKSCLAESKKQIMREKSALSFEDVKKAFEEKGVELVSTEYVNAKTHLKFKCTVCGAVADITWSNFKTGENQNFVCNSCAGIAPPNIEEVREYCLSKGSELISMRVPKTLSKIEVVCSDCGKHFETTWHRIQKENRDILCSSCKEDTSRQFNEVRGRMEAKGAKLTSERYINRRSPLYFTCSKCGREHHITRDAMLSGTNPNFLCDICLKGNCVRPDNQYGSRGSRKRSDTFWFTLVKDFFNIEEKEGFASHHIKPYGAYPEFKTSILNGFPVKKECHSRGYVDERGFKDPFHMDESYLSIGNWDKKYLLEGQEEIGFLDLNSKVVTEIISLEDEDLLGRKRIYAEKGVNYIPVYFEEVFSEKKRVILYSMLRNRLYKDFPHVYEYTRSSLVRIGARKTNIREISSQEARGFLDVSHIQGFAPASVYLGLFYKDNLVQVASFGPPRQKAYRGENCYELIRLASSLNTVVVGGAQKLFKYFVDTYCPQQIISYCDKRFADNDWRNTIYPRLGFKYIGDSKPGYYYVHPKINRLLGRQQFQKAKLKDKLEVFDESLSEKANMEANGYVCLHDCGNMKFVWTSQN